MQTLAKALTLEEFFDLPETKPASEYIDGKIIQKPMPKGKHSAIQGEFVPAINNVVNYQVLPVPSLIDELHLTVQDLFAWLI